MYSEGQAEEILGQAIRGRRDRVLISTKGTFRSLDAASATTLAYPYWHQRGFAERNPPPV